MLSRTGGSRSFPAPAKDATRTVGLMVKVLAVR